MKRKKASLLAFLAVSIILSGCGQKDTTESLVASTASVSTSSIASQKNIGPTALDPAATGSIKGKVSYSGALPPPVELSIRGNPECASLHPDGRLYSEELIAKEGLLKNAFIYIKEGVEGMVFEAPTEAAVISNSKCVYVPHVMGIQVGQPLQIRNEDPTLHNVHSYNKNSKPFNIGLPFQGMKQTKKFEASEIMISLKCDVHPWMIGYVGVLPHPYFAVSDDSGEFEIKNVPPGKFTIEVWHEKLGTQTVDLQLGPQESKEIEFKFA